MIVCLVVDVLDTRLPGLATNGTVKTAACFASQLIQSGNEVRVVCYGDKAMDGHDPATGINWYHVAERKIPLISYLAHRQGTVFAKPEGKVIRRALQGADVLYIYEPFPLDSRAAHLAKKAGIPQIAGFHLQPENITYNLRLGWCPPAAALVYWLLRVALYRRFDHIHCPSKMIATELRAHGYKAQLHVISNGVSDLFKPVTVSEPAASVATQPTASSVPAIPPTPATPAVGTVDAVATGTDTPGAAAGPGHESATPYPDGDKLGHHDGLFHVLVIGRFSPEKRQDVVVEAVRRSAHAAEIQLHFAGFGHTKKHIEKLCRKLPLAPKFGFYDQPELLKLMHACDLTVHASDIDIEGLSCLESIAAGLVPVISDSPKSATSQFALYPESVFRHGDSKSLAARLDYWFEHRAVLQEAGRAYAASAKRYTVARSVRAMERVYQELAPAGHNVYRKCLLNRVVQRIFFSVVAVPLLFLWTRLFMGVRVKGSHNLYTVDGAITVCNHVHWFDAVLVGIAAFPRKPIYPTLRTNLESLFPGLLVHSLGGVPIPERMDELRKFMAEMEFALRDGRLVHMYPEGNLEPYSTELQDFKRGAFRLAAEARVPIIPITISFQEPHGLRKIYKWLRRKPLMFVNIDEPIMPESFDVDIDTALRLGEVRAQMEAELKQNTTAPAKPVKEDLVAA